MNKASKISAVGNSAGVILSKDLLGPSGLTLGDGCRSMHRAGKIEMVVKDKEFERQMHVAREIMVRRREALRELAK